MECVNSVARLHQARHRKMTQGLLDLKRLYWNLHRFRLSHRKDQTPYGLLGLKLPDLSFWEFLKLTPEQLREQPSAKAEISIVVSCKAGLLPANVPTDFAGAFLAHRGSGQRVKSARNRAMSSTALTFCVHNLTMAVVVSGSRDVTS